MHHAIRSTAYSWGTSIGMMQLLYALPVPLAAISVGVDTYISDLIVIIIVGAEIYRDLAEAY